MDIRTGILSLVCIGLLLVAGCASQAPAPATPAPTPVPQTPAPVATTVPPTTADPATCTVAGDCVKAQCCHATSCVNKAAAPKCDSEICTAECASPLDCSAGSCGCVKGQCSVIPATLPTKTTTPSYGYSYKIWATPQRYSPTMSSTPGLELSVITPQADTSTMEFTWTASYGHFVAWKPTDYAVKELGTTTSTREGGKIYWTFTEKPTSTASPVVITMRARDFATNKDLGQSTLNLAWDGDNAVTVKEIV